jgi:hypothetical protein
VQEEECPPAQDQLQFMYLKIDHAVVHKHEGEKEREMLLGHLGPCGWEAQDSKWLWKCGLELIFRCASKLNLPLVRVIL